MKLSEQVEKLERDNEKLRWLCGQVIATLNVNRIRNTITSIDEKRFDQIIENWSLKLKELTDPLTEMKTISESDEFLYQKDGYGNNLLINKKGLDSVNLL